MSSQSQTFTTDDDASGTIDAQTLAALRMELDRIRSDLGSFASSAVNQASAAGEQVKRTIRTHPVPAIVAFGACGILLAGLLRRPEPAPSISRRLVSDPLGVTRADLYDAMATLRRSMDDRFDRKSLLASAENVVTSIGQLDPASAINPMIDRIKEVYGRLTKPS